VTASAGAGGTQALVAEESILYDGLQLRSGWIAEIFGLAGDAVVAFLGPCETPTEHLVDLDDREAGESLRAAQMLHVIAEQRPPEISLAVLRQRLLVAGLVEALRWCGVTGEIVRSGDDIYVGGRKLTVSIATVSATAGLIHLGINVDPTGAPVPAIGLAELRVPPLALASTLLESYVREMAAAAYAETKVRSVP
jgi:uncharacterized protein